MLLNYTTKIEADKTAQEIAKCLSLHGAQAVLTEYDEKEQIVSAISFRIKMGEQVMSFRLPCDWHPVYDILVKQKKLPNTWVRNYESAVAERKLQAVRTAWRIVKDWVEAQMALVETQMVTTGQVFLPYLLMKDERTLSQHIAENPNMLQLGSGE